MTSIPFVIIVPLAVQQDKAISQHMSVKVKYYTDDTGVDFWNNNTWEKDFG